MLWFCQDNSGIKIATQLKIKNSKRSNAEPGDLLTIFPKKFKYVKVIKRQKYLGLVTMTRRLVKRQFYYLKGPLNKLVILNRDEKFVGSKIFGCILEEVRARRFSSYKYKRVYARVGGRFV